jgi:Ca-activated chloride channel homolog
MIPGLGTFAWSDFAEPFWLWFAIFPVAVVAMYVAAQERSQRRLRRFAGAQAAAAVRRPYRRHVPLVAMVFALAALTIGLGQPEKDVLVPVNRAVVMLVVDVSESMKARDVAPSRLQAAEQAASTFVGKLAPGINLGLVAFSGNAVVVVSPTPRHDETTTALGLLRTGPQTATGAGLFAALSSIDTLDSVLSQLVSTAPPARIVLLSDGKENIPDNPDAPHGAYTAARAAADQHVPVSTITIGTSDGSVVVDGANVAVPVDDSSMRRIAELSGGHAYDAANSADLATSYADVTDELGVESERVPDGTAWLRLSTLLATMGVGAGLLINRRIPA